METDGAWGDEKVCFRPPKRLQRLTSIPGQPVIPYIMCGGMWVGEVRAALARDEQMEAIGRALHHTCRRWELESVHKTEGGRECVCAQVLDTLWEIS